MRTLVSDFEARTAATMLNPSTEATAGDRLSGEPTAYLKSRGRREGTAATGAATVSVQSKS